MKGPRRSQYLGGKEFSGLTRNKSKGRDEKTCKKLKQSVEGTSGRPGTEIIRVRLIDTATIALHFGWYNFCQIHGSLRVTTVNGSGVDGSCLERTRITGVDSGIAASV